MSGWVDGEDARHALAAAAARLIADPALGRRMAEAGAERLAAEFSVDRICAQWRDLLQPYGVG